LAFGAPLSRTTQRLPIPCKEFVGYLIRHRASDSAKPNHLPPDFQSFAPPPKKKKKRKKKLQTAKQVWIQPLNGHKNFTKISLNAVCHITRHTESRTPQFQQAPNHEDYPEHIYVEIHNQ